MATVHICGYNKYTHQCYSDDESKFLYIGIGWQPGGERCLEMEEYCKKQGYTMTAHPYLIEILLAGILGILVVAFRVYRN